jgi:hypothetical protein
MQRPELKGSTLTRIEPSIAIRPRIGSTLVICALLEQQQTRRRMLLKMICPVPKVSPQQTILRSFRHISSATLLEALAAYCDGDFVRKHGHCSSEHITKAGLGVSQRKSSSSATSTAILPGIPGPPRYLRIPAIQSQYLPSPIRLYHTSVLPSKSWVSARIGNDFE